MSLSSSFGQFSMGSSPDLTANSLISELASGKKLNQLQLRPSSLFNTSTTATTPTTSALSRLTNPQLSGNGLQTVSGTLSLLRGSQTQTGTATTGQGQSFITPIILPQAPSPAAPPPVSFAPVVQRQAPSSSSNNTSQLFGMFLIMLSSLVKSRNKINQSKLPTNDENNIINKPEAGSNSSNSRQIPESESTVTGAKTESGFDPELERGARPPAKETPPPVIEPKPPITETKPPVTETKPPIVDSRPENPPVPSSPPSIPVVEKPAADPLLEIKPGQEQPGVEKPPAVTPESGQFPGNGKGPLASLDTANPSEGQPNWRGGPFNHSGGQSGNPSQNGNPWQGKGSPRFTPGRGR